ncbi:hypothetical protein JMJ55_28120 [Belnapia sp. T6]|uniref:Pectate lyase domain-containing protein n=1 Tax=Belnapia mucosa TaxID=2804532 RepID=A0ABS1VC07_9PROT|nr:hypothetical protein [Belnapia mucosa]MBL6459193.1 hypothetical protein [Belnapia mucosa]
MPLELRVEEGRVVDAAILSRIEGYGRGTTGGLGKRLLVVTSKEDHHSSNSRPLVPGTLRWVVETAVQEGGGWIRFAPSLTGQAIRVSGSLRLGPNTTLDGGCSGVRLVAAPQVSILRVASRNVVVTGLTFSKDEYAESGERTGDAINVTEGFDRLAILHNAFRRCGDGCVDIFRRNRSEEPARATVAFNLFEDHNKVMLVGSAACGVDRGAPGCDAGAEPYSPALRPEVFVTMQANVFRHTSQRMPKVVSNGLADVVNNVLLLEHLRYPDGRSSALYGALAQGGGVLFFRNNLLARIEGDGRPQFGAGPFAEFGRRVPSVDGPGIAVSSGNLALDGFTVASSSFLPPWTPQPLPMPMLDPQAMGAVQFARCVRRIAGPGGASVSWPDVCR